MKIANKDALIGVDIQNDFLPGGALAVNDGDSVISITDALSEKFIRAGGFYVLTQDTHPANHVSFASNNSNATVFDTKILDYGLQVMWPDHCVIGTRGMQLADELVSADNAHLILRKGKNPYVDSYSGFMEADRRTTTGLTGWLRERGVERVFLTGLATDYCVAWTAFDAVEQGFETYVVLDATRGIYNSTTEKLLVEDFERRGIKVIKSSDL